MSAIDRFMEDVKHRIAPGLPGAARFEADLRRHLRERVEAGEDEDGAVKHMGPPADVVADFLESADPPLATPGQLPRRGPLLRRDGFRHAGVNPLRRPVSSARAAAAARPRGRSCSSRPSRKIGRAHV